MSSDNAQRVQGAGPLTGAGDPFDVDVIGGPGVNGSAFNLVPQGTYSATQAIAFTNPTNTGVIIFVEITAVGTGSLTPVLQFMNGQSGFAYQISTGLVPLRATVIPVPNRVAYIFSPGASLNAFATQNGFKYVNPIACPRDLRFQMTHSNATAWDYRVDAVFMG